MVSASAFRSRGPWPGWSAGVAVVLALALLAGTAAAFLPHQSLWVDETTQLAGLGLGPHHLMPWLMGFGPDLGMPPDRMPPGAYLLQMAWGAAGGISERGMRWFSLGCVLVGALFTALAAWRAYGRLAAVASSLFLAISPNVTVYAVEIRAYPLFLMFSGATVYAFVRVAEGGASRGAWLAALTAALLAAMYTHFFGLVLAGAVLLALLIEALRTRQRVLPVLATGGVIAVAALGLEPFVTAAAGLSDPASPGTSVSAAVRGNVRLLYRLYGHPAMAACRLAQVLATGGIVLALAAGAITVLHRRTVRVAEGTVLITGLTVVMVASFAVASFEAAAPHYNVWALPFLALLLTRGLTGPWNWPRAAALGGVACLLIGSALGSAELLRHPDAYSHGPQGRLFALLASMDPTRSS